MALLRLFDPTTQFQTKSGALNVAGKLRIYVESTDDLANIYGDDGSRLPQPLILDSNGRARGLFVDSGRSYRLEVYDRNDSLLFTIRRLEPNASGTIVNPTVFIKGTPDEIDVEDSVTEETRTYTVSLSAKVTGKIAENQEAIVKESEARKGADDELRKMIDDSSKVEAGTASPLMDGKASVGNSLKYAREDHVHPSDTSREDIANKTTVVLGTSDSKYPTDKAVAEFVNSSIATNTANYISNNGEPFTSVEQLEAYSGPVTNNDYAFVTGIDSEGNTYYDRYKATVSGSTVTWALEYRLNNSSFTAAQWSAINSGITSVLVAKIHDHSNKDVLDGITSDKVNYWDGKQDALKAGSGITISNSTISALNRLIPVDISTNETKDFDNLPSDNILYYKNSSIDFSNQPERSALRFIQWTSSNYYSVQLAISNNKKIYIRTSNANSNNDGKVWGNWTRFANIDELDKVNSSLTTHKNNTTVHITADERTAWNAKQAALTFDTTPTAGSTNPVTSDGIKSAIEDSVDQTYSSTSTKAQSGVAVNEAFKTRETSSSGDSYTYLGMKKTYNGTEEVYWKLVSFNAVSNYWTLQFEVDVSNGRKGDASYDTEIYETKRLTICGTKPGVVTYANELRYAAQGIDSNRGYGNNIYYEIGSSNLVTVYIKAIDRPNKTQLCRLKDVINFQGISNITWHEPVNDAGTQPTNPVKFKEVFPAIASTSFNLGSESVPVYVNNGKPRSCNTSNLKAGKDDDGNVIKNTYATKTELSTHTSDTTVHITEDERTAWNAKQAALTFDTTPTAGSTNPVTSGGIKTALDLKANASDLSKHTGDTTVHITAAERTAWNAKQSALTFDTTPKASSTNPVTSDGIKTAIDGVQSTLQTNIDTVGAKGIVINEIDGENVICFE